MNYKPYESVLKDCSLLQGIQSDEYNHILSCLDVQIKSYAADDYIFLHGDQVDSVGIVLEGIVEVVKENMAGNRHIVAVLQPSGLFGEGIVCTRNRISPVAVHTRTKVVILHIPYQRILTTCHNACGFHTTLIHNMTLLLGEKNYVLNHKIDLLMLKGMREKLAAYLLYEAAQTGRDSFELPLNRNELADYLNVSRPSMSRELLRMQDEGLLTFHKNKFTLLDKEGITDCLDSD